MVDGQQLKELDRLTGSCSTVKVGLQNIGIY